MNIVTKITRHLNMSTSNLHLPGKAIQEFEEKAAKGKEALQRKDLLVKSTTPVEANGNGTTVQSLPERDGPEGMIIPNTGNTIQPFNEDGICSRKKEHTDSAAKLFSDKPSDPSHSLRLRNYIKPESETGYRDPAELVLIVNHQEKNPTKSAAELFYLKQSFESSSLYPNLASLDPSSPQVTNQYTKPKSETGDRDQAELVIK